LNQAPAANCAYGVPGARNSTSKNLVAGRVAIRLGDQRFGSAGTGAGP
jgi:hypothetical protein